MSENRLAAGINTNRIEAFSDGVFAVAITLLVLNLQVPQLAASVVSRELVAKLFELWPKFLFTGGFLPPQNISDHQELI